MCGSRRRRSACNTAARGGFLAHDESVACEDSRTSRTCGMKRTKWLRGTGEYDGTLKGGEQHTQRANLRALRVKEVVCAGVVDSSRRFWFLPYATTCSATTIQLPTTANSTATSTLLPPPPHLIWIRSPLESGRTCPSGACASALDTRP